MKRTLSLLLALVMVLGSFSAVFAAMPTTNVEKAELLNKLEILKGNDSGDLLLEQDLKRRDAVVLLSRLMGVEEEAANFPTDALSFNDIEIELYKHYIAWGEAKGYVAGKTETTFAPNDPLTAQQFATFLLRALGYEVDAEAYKTAFETAKELGILADVNVEKGTQLKRSHMAGMTFNALYVEVKGEGKTLAEKLELTVPQEEAEFAIEVKATKANQLTITFASPVNKDNVTVKVTRSAANVAGELKWESETVALYNTTAKMSNGTYTVEATLKVEGQDDKVAKATTEVVSQFVNQIVILNDVALTARKIKSDPTTDGKLAYAYYDVLDQYGESVRTTTNVTWSASVKATADRTTGRIVLERSDDKAFTYGEQIFLSGVDTKTGVNVTKTLTVGQAQALNSIEVAGFIKKGTSEILKVLPSGFKAGTYYMVFELRDQNGNPYTADKTELSQQVTFISDNVLVIKELKNFGDFIVINGAEYATVEVEPGINVDRGGEVNIIAIANNTGNKTTINTVVGEHQILTSFELLPPTSIIADGESVEIPFKAYDQHGEEIKNFTTIARHSSFNALTLTASDNTTLTLSENADGTAKLTFTDKTMNWSDPQTTDGHDRMVSLTSIVVGGNTSNLMINIQDKARPMGIKNVTMDNVLVHKGSTTVRLNNNSSTESNPNTFEFVDQYGRDMKRKDAIAFFDVTFGAGHNSDFAGYKFAVRATYKGGTGNFSTSGTADGAGESDIANDTEIIIYKDQDLTLTANVGDAPITSRSGMTMRFDIVKVKGDKVEGVSPVKSEPLTIININQVRSIEIKEIGKVYIPTSNSNNLTGATVGNTPAQWNTEKADVVPFSTAGSYGWTEAHKRKVLLTGKYNNETVNIPAIYVEAENATGSALKVEVESGTMKITGATDSLLWKDLYDITTAQYNRKDGEATITVNVYNKENTAIDKQKLTTASRVVTISDAKPVLTTIKGDDTWTARPEETKIANVKDYPYYGIHTLFSVEEEEYKYLDQYEVSIVPQLRYRVSSIVENVDGYALNNFNYTGNDTQALEITGAERGDTFVITIVASKDGVTVTKDVKVTVGADLKAKIDSVNGNVYLKDLIGDGTDGKLENQRLDTLK